MLNLNLPIILVILNCNFGSEFLKFLLIRSSQVTAAKALNPDDNVLIK